MGTYGTEANRAEAIEELVQAMRQKPANRGLSTARLFEEAARVYDEAEAGWTQRAAQDFLAEQQADEGLDYVEAVLAEQVRRDARDRTRGKAPPNTNPLVPGSTKW